MKTLREFWHWILLAIAVLGTAHIVAYKQHNAAAKYQAHRARYSASLVGSTEQQKACLEEKDDANSELPWWAVLYTWPEGFTTWAIIGTGFVIAWQSSETRKAAKATEAQAEISREALVSQFRPKIAVRRVRLDPPATKYFDRRMDGIWKLELTLHNIGGTTAHVQKCQGFFNLQSGEDGRSKDSVSGLYIDKPSDIPAGGKHPLEIRLDEVRFRKMLGEVEDDVRLEDGSRGSIRPDWFLYYGTITYRDDNGLDRDTGFSRQWYTRGQHFLASDDVEAEYQE